MFTKNYYNLAQGQIVGVGTTNVLPYIYYKLINIAGNTPASYSGYGQENGGMTRSGSYDFSNLMSRHVMKPKSEFVAESKYSSYYNTKDIYGIVFGNGQDAESIDSYTMSGDLFTDYTVSSVQSFEIDDNGMVRVVMFTLTNTGSEDFTISELGLVTYAYITNTNGYCYENNFLLERTVLENPITIPANGGVGQVTYTIRMDYPVA